MLRLEGGDLRDLLADALGGDTLAFRDLDRVKFPGSGGTTWEVPSLDGEIATKELEGVIVQRNTNRTYWSTILEDRADDDDGRPDCASVDGFTGVGSPGGDCAVCPLNEFGSDLKGGPGKACKETRQLFLLTKDDLFPLVITVPPGSLAVVKDYFMRLVRRQVLPHTVVTKLTLTKEKNSANIAFAKLVLTKGETLSPEAAARVKAYAEMLAPAMESAARVKQDEVEG
jgi:hypothetical protein